VGAVVDPLARGRDPFARGNGSSMAHDRHDVTMSTRRRAQDAETILGVVVGYSLDEACQHFPGVRLRAHAVIAPSVFYSLLVASPMLRLGWRC